MGARSLIFLIIAVILISACSVQNKTKPVITDLPAGNVVQDIKEKEPAPAETPAKPAIEVPETAEEKEEEKPAAAGNKEELPSTSHVVIIKDLKLEPRELNISVGDTVVWKDEDEWEKEGETKHYLVAHSNEFRSPHLYYGDTFSHTFSKKGTFTYFDVIYKDKENLKGKIIVE